MGEFEKKFISHFDAANIDELFASLQVSDKKQTKL